MARVGHSIALIVLAVMVATAASAEQCIHEYVVGYATENSKLLSRVHVEFPTSKSVEKAIADRKGVVASPQGTGSLFIDGADMTKGSPWTTRVYIVTHSPVANGVILTVHDHGNGGVRASWLNEKLVFLQVWWGRIHSTDLVLDVGRRKWIYSEAADYMKGILPQCAEAERNERHEQ